MKTSLLPWKWGRKNVPVKVEENRPQPVCTSGDTAIYSAQNELSKIFDDFFTAAQRSFAGLAAAEDLYGGFQPRLEVKETDKELHFSLEMPGMSEKDTDLTVSGEGLLIKGEKREERQDSARGYYKMERRYGSFVRQIPFPCPVLTDSARAFIKHGVLTVTLSKDEQARSSTRRIEVSKG